MLTSYIPKAAPDLLIKFKEPAPSDVVADLQKSIRRLQNQIERLKVTALAHDASWEEVLATEQENDLSLMPPTVGGVPCKYECACCDALFARSDLTLMTSGQFVGHNVCAACKENPDGPTSSQALTKCGGCEFFFASNELTHASSGAFLCVSCFENYAEQPKTLCACCVRYLPSGEVTPCMDGGWKGQRLCKECKEMAARQKVANDDKVLKGTMLTGSAESPSQIYLTWQQPAHETFYLWRGYADTWTMLALHGNDTPSDQAHWCADVCLDAGREYRYRLQASDGKLSETISVTTPGGHKAADDDHVAKAIAYICSPDTCRISAPGSSAEPSFVVESINHGDGTYTHAVPSKALQTCGMFSIQLRTDGVYSANTANAVDLGQSENKTPEVGNAWNLPGRLYGMKVEIEDALPPLNQSSVTEVPQEVAQADPSYPFVDGVAAAEQTHITEQAAESPNAKKETWRDRPPLFR